jgi:hypothetical protein
MDVLDLPPGVSLDNRKVAFLFSDGKEDIECTVTREALETHFWLPRNADAGRVLKTFTDGRHRIAAIARRKWLAMPVRPVRLTSDDFVLR